MTRYDAIQYLNDNSEQNTVRQRLALLAAIQDVLYASEGAFDMSEEEVRGWLDDSLAMVARGESGNPDDSV